MLVIVSQSVQGRPGPARALEIYCAIRWISPQPGFPLDLAGSLSCSDRVISNQVALQQFQHPSPAFANNMEVQGTLIAPLTASALRWIEETRGQHDVILTLQLNNRSQEAVPWESQTQTYLGARVSWQPVRVSITIPRSDWLKRLQEMEWNETEIFEIVTSPLQSQEALEEALRLLRESRETLRNGDYKGVLVRCREAFESAARHTSPSGDTRQGFELILGQAFPEDEAKRSSLNATIQAFSQYLHAVGRHAQVPALIVTRGEAEFALATTYSFFSLISRRLAQLETT